MAEQTPRVLKDVVIEKGGVPNRNGRIYPTEVLEKIAKAVKQRHGELRYLQPDPVPADASMEQRERINLTISLARASHSIENLRVVDDTLICDVRLLPTTAGQLLAKYLDDVDHQDKIGFTLRGFAQFGEDRVVSDYQFVTIDAGKVRE